MNKRFDLAVVGAGSGGIGAATAAARLGLSVLLIEKADALGGNAVRGGVHVWEAGVGGTGIPFDIYRRLKRIPGAVGVYSFRRHVCWPEPGSLRFPGGEMVIDPARRYADSLRRHGAPSLRDDEAFFREHVHGVVFEPEAYTRVVEEMLAETGQCAVLAHTKLVGAHVDSGRVTSLRLSGGLTVEADVFIDCTADALLCLACGCETLTGQESRETFDEPHAPEKATGRVNGVTLIFRITPTDEPGIEPLPGDVPRECWWRDRFPSTCCSQYPCGDFNMNMLPTMDGEEFLRLEYDDAYEECRRRLLAHWHQNQTTFPEFQQFRLSWIAPALGVRETRRTVCEYMLTEHDLVWGLAGQTHPDIVTIVDHPMDTHGKGGVGGEVRAPYGVPFRCLVPKGVENLLVACRGAGFSSLAASSCRLSRTIMQLGQAAGTAAALAKECAVVIADLPADELRQSLRDQYVQLDWPMPNDLADHLAENDATGR